MTFAALMIGRYGRYVSIVIGEETPRTFAGRVVESSAQIVAASADARDVRKMYSS